MQSSTVQPFTGTKRFEIEREIGHGGMGVVYQARDRERNTRVALKALTQKDALNIYRLKNEFRQLADLSHPNLVTLHELYNEGNSWFFTMELVQGRTFDEYVADDRPTTQPERARVETVATRHPREASITLSQRAIASEFPMARVTCNVKRLRHALRQLVEAVAALHEAGKLHRDLKPSNVLVTAEGRVVVLDFGLVSNTTFVDPEAQDADRTVGGCVFGTPAYMSPEQAAGEAVTPASDWYAVGTMLFEALTGQLPFDGSVLEILRQKEEQEPTPPSEIVRGVPDDLDQLCRDLLRRDPVRRPSGAEILHYLTGHSSPRRAFDAQSSVISRHQSELFVGRESHLGELRCAFEATKAGKPITMLVHGVSGIGKSALVRCFANELIRADEAVVLRGRCYERETVPYKAFDNIIDALSRYMMRLPAEEAAELLPRNVHSLAVLFPVLRRVKAIAHARRPKNPTGDARELRNQAFASLKDLLLRITDYHPLVINIDDLQWADMDSARLLSFLIGPPDPPPLLLVGTYRRDEAGNSPFLQHLASDRSLNEGAAELRELAVDALTDAEATQLTSALLRDLPEATALFSSAIAAEAEGVPFFITELVQHLRTRSSRPSGGTRSESLSLDQVILDRIAGMPNDAQRLLQVLSVAAGPIEQGVAIDAAGLPSGDRAAMLTLRAARLIRTRGTRQEDTAETYHDRVRETVVNNLHAEAVRDVHARIAHALERYDVGDPERLVVHYTGAGDGVRAGETAIEAGHRAARKLAFNRAVELFKRAIELLPNDEPVARGLYCHLGDALANAGRGAQAAEAYLQAAAGREPSEARKLERLAAQQYLRSGHLEQGLPLTVRLLERSGSSYPHGPKAALGAYLLERARLMLAPVRYVEHREQEISPEVSERLDTLEAVFKEVTAFDPVRGALLHARFLRESLRYGDPARVTLALAWEAINTGLLSGESKAGRVQSLLATTDEFTLRVKTPYARATALVARAACELSCGQPRDVEELASRAEQIFRNECRGAAWEAAFARTWRYAGIELAGNLATLVHEAADNERDAREKGDNYSISTLTLVVPMAHLMRDDANAALQHLEAQSARLSGDFNSFHLWVMDRTTDAHLYAGNSLTAWEYLESRWKQFKSSSLSRARLLHINGLFLRGRAAVAGARESRRDELTRIAREAARELRKFSRPDAIAYSCLLQAALARNADDAGRARLYLEHAVTTCVASGLRNFELYAKRNLAVLSGASAGQAIRAEVDAELEAKGVQRPERWTRAYAPGFDD
jgi:serine/threonine protein kinase